MSRAQELIEDIKRHSAALTVAENELLALADGPRVTLSYPELVRSSTARVARAQAVAEESTQATAAVLALRAERPRNTGMRAKIVDLLNDEPERVFEAKTVAECTGQSSIAMIQNLLGELAKDGFIRRITRGRYQAQTDGEPQAGAPRSEEAS